MGGTDRRREKNRIAQRRFRERQKSTVSMLQTELDQKFVEMQRMRAQIIALEQTVQVSCTARSNSLSFLLNFSLLF